MCGTDWSIVNFALVVDKDTRTMPDTWLVFRTVACWLVPKKLFVRNKLKFTTKRISIIINWGKFYGCKKSFRQKTSTKPSSILLTRSMQKLLRWWVIFIRASEMQVGTISYDHVS